MGRTSTCPARGSYHASHCCMGSAHNCMGCEDFVDRHTMLERPRSPPGCGSSMPICSRFDSAVEVLTLIQSVFSTWKSRPNPDRPSLRPGQGQSQQKRMQTWQCTAIHASAYWGSPICIPEPHSQARRRAMQDGKRQGMGPTGGASTGAAAREVPR